MTPKDVPTPIHLPEDIELELVEGTEPVDRSSVGGRSPAAAGLELAFTGELFAWRGPAPYHFIAVPPEAAGQIHAVARAVTYGWGMIPATVRIGGSTWDTALWPRDGGYVLPIKDRYRKAEQLGLGDSVAVRVIVHR